MYNYVTNIIGCNNNCISKVYLHKLFIKWMNMSIILDFAMLISEQCLCELYNKEDLPAENHLFRVYICIYTNYNWLAFKHNLF